MSGRESDFEGPAPAEAWDRDIARHMLDELFSLTHQYRSSDRYWEFLRFVARFRHYSPFNAMLVNIQMSGARYVAPPTRWRRNYGRTVRADARPLVILQPMGPVMFVFDVSDTVPEDGAPPLPKEVTHPFEVRGRAVGGEYELTRQNAVRDGVDIHDAKEGSQGAGRIIRRARPGRSQLFPTEWDAVEQVQVSVRYDVVLNSMLSREAQYATLVHELAHLYCGHLGTPSPRWWPDRRGLMPEVEEFEAESVCYLVCRRLGVDTESEAYLSGYGRRSAETPSISLECVMKAAGLIESMGRMRLPARRSQSVGRAV